MITLRAEGKVGGGRTSILHIVSNALTAKGYFVDWGGEGDEHTLYVRTPHEIARTTQTGLKPPTGSEG